MNSCAPATFARFPAPQQEALAEQLLRQELKEDLVLPTFEEWREQSSQLPLFR